MREGVKWYEAARRRRISGKTAAPSVRRGDLRIFPWKCPCGAPPNLNGTPDLRRFRVGKWWVLWHWPMVCVWLSAIGNAVAEGLGSFGKTGGGHALKIGVWIYSMTMSFS